MSKHIESINITISPQIKEKLESIACKKNLDLQNLINDVLTEVVLVDDEDAWFYSDYWRDRLKKVDEDISKGKVTDEFVDMDEAIKWLKT